MRKLLDLAFVFLVGMLTSVTMSSCSDDDDPALEIAVLDSQLDTFCPNGTATVKLSVSDPDVILSKDLFRCEIKQLSTQGMVMDIFPSIEIEKLEKNGTEYLLQLKYDLKNLSNVDMVLGFAYEDAPQVAGTLNWRMKRAHKYGDLVVLKTNEKMSGRFFFPVFTFLDQLKVEHMSFREIGRAKQTFFAPDGEAMYQASKKDDTKVYTIATGSSSAGELAIVGLKNGEFNVPYTIINQIKLVQPDKDGNEYIWLEYEFVMQLDEEKN